MRRVTSPWFHPAAEGSEPLLEVHSNCPSSTDRMRGQAITCENRLTAHETDWPQRSMLAQSAHDISREFRTLEYDPEPVGATRILLRSVALSWDHRSWFRRTDKRGVIRKSEEQA